MPQDKTKRLETILEGVSALDFIFILTILIDVLNEQTKGA